MLFSLRELVQWLGFATFEIFLHGLALLAFSVLLVLKVDGEASALSWWVVFVPFFAADGLSTYFTAIVSVRLFQDGEKRLAGIGYWKDFRVLDTGNTTLISYDLVEAHDGNIKTGESKERTEINDTEGKSKVQAGLAAGGGGAQSHSKDSPASSERSHLGTHVRVLLGVRLGACQQW
nr:PREDICTED: transmembrane protein 203 [Opisthocomus hoazin]